MGLISPLLQGLGNIGLGLYLRASFQLLYPFGDSFSKRSYILMYWRLGFQYKHFENSQFNQAYLIFAKPWSNTQGYKEQIDRQRESPQIPQQGNMAIFKSTGLHLLRGVMQRAGHQHFMQIKPSQPGQGRLWVMGEGLF